MPSASPRRAIALGNTALTTLDADVSVVVSNGFKLSVNGLTVVGQPSFAAAEETGVKLRVFERSAQFAIGDFANYIEDRFGEEAAQILDAESGWSAKTLSVYRWVASRIAQDRRRMDRLGIRHHLLVAGLTPAQQTKWLKKAADSEDEPWTVSRLALALRNEEDLPPSCFWVLASASSANDQASLMTTLEAQGRSVKAVMRRDRKAKKS